LVNSDNSFINTNKTTINIKLLKNIASNSAELPEELSVNWFAYFNILMLYLFAVGSNTTAHNLNLETASYAWDNCDFSNYSVNFDGINGVTKITYSYNGVHSSASSNYGAIKKTSKEEKCGDMVLSPYLKIGGGNTVNEQGLIESCYCLQFKKRGIADTGVE
jgi:hypothetical protein